MATPREPIIDTDSAFVMLAATWHAKRIVGSRSYDPGATETSRSVRKILAKGGPELDAIVAAYREHCAEQKRPGLSFDTSPPVELEAIPDPTPAIPKPPPKTKPKVKPMPEVLKEPTNGHAKPADIRRQSVMTAQELVAFGRGVAAISEALMQIDPKQQLAALEHVVNAFRKGA